MKKKIAAMMTAACLLSVNCFAAVTSVDENYTTDVTVVTVVTVSGTAAVGDHVAYVVFKKDSNPAIVSNIVHVGDIEVTAQDGKFDIKFGLDDDAETGDYIVRIGWLDGSESKVFNKEIHFVNVSAVVDAIKGATAVTDLEAIFKSDGGHTEALEQLGMDYEILNSLSDGKTKVLTDLLNDADRTSADAAGIVSIFNKYLGREMINARKSGGLGKINPSFGNPAVKYNDLTDTTLKTYLDNGIYSATYTTVSEVSEAYTKLNIIYLINSSDAGELVDLIAEYDAELGLTDESFYNTYKSYSKTNQNKAAANYLDYAEDESVTSVEKFRELFKKAVNDAKPSGDSGGGGGTGGGSYSGGSSYTPIATESVSMTNERFNDLGDVEWAKEAVNALADKGIINGVAKETFAPSDNVTREQMVKMLLLAIGEDAEASEVPFKDVDFSEWYAPYVAKAYSLGLVNGISDTLFGTGENITRQDLAVIAVRAAKYGNIIKEETHSKSAFNDRNKIADYACEAVDTLYSLGVISGKDGNVFAPEDYCTRAEAAKIIYNTFFK